MGGLRQPAGGEAASGFGYIFPRFPMHCASNPGSLSRTSPGLTAGTESPPLSASMATIEGDERPMADSPVRARLSERRRNGVGTEAENCESSKVD